MNSFIFKIYCVKQIMTLKPYKKTLKKKNSLTTFVKKLGNLNYIHSQSY